MSVVLGTSAGTEVEDFFPSRVSTTLAHPVVNVGSNTVPTYSVTRTQCLWVTTNSEEGTLSTPLVRAANGTPSPLT